MTIEEQLAQFMQDIGGRVDALGGRALTDEERNKLVTDIRSSLMEDPEFVRKMRFGGAGPEDAALQGSKYARLGLSVADIEFLYGVLGSAASRGLSRGGPSKELHATFRALQAPYGVRVMDNATVRQSDARKLEELFESAPSAWYSGADRALAERGAWYETKAFQTAMRAMDTAEAGFGQQLVGAQYVRELWEVARRESRVFALLNTFEMTDPTAYLPTEVDFPEPILASESTANNSSNYGTQKTGSRRSQVDAKKLLIHQMWSGEMEEDSLVPFVPFLRGQIQKSLAFYSDSVILNGDLTNAATGNINLDDADPADTKFYLAFDGIRHLGLVDNTANSKDAAGPATLGLLNGQRGRMLDTTNKIDWGHPNDMGDLVRVSDPETADRIALFDEAVTVDKYGPQAGVLTGEIARILGNPLISSIAVSKTEADGKVSTTAANNTKGQVIAFNRNGFVVGWRRRVQIETERLPATDQSRIVASLRIGFGRHLTGADATTAEQADVLYNITL